MRLKLWFSQFTPLISVANQRKNIKETKFRKLVGTRPISVITQKLYCININYINYQDERFPKRTYIQEVF